MQDISKKAKKIVASDSQDQSSIDDQTTSESPKKSGKAKLVLWIVMGIVLVSSIGAAAYYYKQYQDVKSDPKAAQEEKNKAETDRVMDNLRAIILITETDAPTVARVEDPEKLKASNAEFYKDIQTGDYLIIFPRRAIIFRESTNQIINIAPIISTADIKAKEGTTPAATEQPQNRN